MNQTLIKAYLDAVYVVYYNDRPKKLKVGENYSWLDQLIQQHSCSSAVFITASNPQSQQLTESANQESNDKMRQYFEHNGYCFLPGYGTDKTGSWPKEESYLVFGLPFNEADCLARQFRQNAYLRICPFKNIELKLLNYNS